MQAMAKSLDMPVEVLKQFQEQYKKQSTSPKTAEDVSSSSTTFTSASPKPETLVKAPGSAVTGSAPIVPKITVFGGGGTKAIDTDLGKPTDTSALGHVDHTDE